MPSRVKGFEAKNPVAEAIFYEFLINFPERRNDKALLLNFSIVIKKFELSCVVCEFYYDYYSYKFSEIVESSYSYYS